MWAGGRDLEFAMEPEEKSLYDDVTAYLLEPQLLPSAAISGSFC